MHERCAMHINANVVVHFPSSDRPRTFTLHARNVCLRGLILHDVSTFCNIALKNWQRNLAQIFFFIIYAFMRFLPYLFASSNPQKWQPLFFLKVSLLNINMTKVVFEKKSNFLICKYFRTSQDNYSMQCSCLNCLEILDMTIIIKVNLHKGRCSLKINCHWRAQAVKFLKGCYLIALLARHKNGQFLTFRLRFVAHLGRFENFHFMYLR